MPSRSCEPAAERVAGWLRIGVAGVTVICAVGAWFCTVTDWLAGALESPSSVSVTTSFALKLPSVE